MSFTNATQAQLAGVTTAIAAAQATLNVLIENAQAVLAQPLGSSVVSIATNLEAQSAAASQLPTLYALGSVLSRMASNVAAAGQGGSQKTLVGGDLSFLAASVYGDATAWTTIARANKLLDPVLEGINTLTIPPTSDGDQGVYLQ